jgi:hypothetical protein
MVKVMKRHKKTSLAGGLMIIRALATKSPRQVQVPGALFLHNEK